MKRDEKKRLHDIKIYMGTGLAVLFVPALAPVLTEAELATPVALGFAVAGAAGATAANVAFHRLTAEPDMDEKPDGT